MEIAVQSTDYFVERSGVRIHIISGMLRRQLEHPQKRHKEGLTLAQQEHTSSHTAPAKNDCLWISLHERDFMSFSFGGCKEYPGTGGLTHTPFIDDDHRDFLKLLLLYDSKYATLPCGPPPIERSIAVALHRRGIYMRLSGGISCLDVGIIPE